MVEISKTKVGKACVYSNNGEHEIYKFFNNIFFAYYKCQIIDG